MQETRVRSLGRKDTLEKEMATHSGTLAWKIPWTEEPGRLQSMGSQSRTRLSNFTFTFSSSDGEESTCNAGGLVPSLGREDPLEKEMAPHSSTLAWKIPWTEEPGRLQSMGSQRVGHD